MRNLLTVHFLKREEKKIDVSQVKELLEKSLKEKPLVGVDNRTEFYNVSKVEGEVKLNFIMNFSDKMYRLIIFVVLFFEMKVTIVAVRGKKRAGYHLKISIKYRGIKMIIILIGSSWRTRIIFELTLILLFLNLQNRNQRV